MSRSRMSTPFASRLGTNYCPDYKEILDIRAILVEPVSRLKQLDDQIADLQKAIDVLAEERAGIGSFVDAHEALLSPVRRLPLDVIQEIFEACLPHRNCAMSAVEAPVLLGRICSSWRTISLTTPLLWTRLHIVEPGGIGSLPTDGDGVREEVAQRLETVKTWLSRSGVCPISISFIGALDARPESTCLFLQALVPFASRWQNLTLAISWKSEVLDTLCKLTENDLPMLSALQILHIGGSSRARMLDLPIPWTNLTFLALNGGEAVINPEIALEVLSKCRHIESCQLWLPYPTPPFLPAANHSVIRAELPHLRTLDIMGSLDGTGLIFRGLSVPALYHFTLDGAMLFEDPALSSQCIAFLATSSRLESLRVVSDAFGEGYPDILRALPALKRLYINDSYTVLEAIIAALTPTADTLGDASCPHLEELHIKGGSISDNMLLRFITARMRTSNRTLTRVEIALDRQMEFDIRECIQAFLDNGLEFRATYFQPPPPTAFSPWHGLEPDL
ncbi:hypothetical protein C8R46DRAFT_670165 [Mycena filopes]|nr:hypothetical protein C8R46DRAFT_670165 [Mycena filopes]